LYDFLDILSGFPEIGTVEKKDLNIRGFVIVARLTVFYQIRDGNIIILIFTTTGKTQNKKDIKSHQLLLLGIKIQV
jgi:hypothetical protein